ncbi:MAG: YihY/virulence factor BrkB family protein [Allosphingosinicella sp.]|uniref:YihY/virulence factor BrkB family protein n=1 Tax=Allosphingosinicella sp. TaxID=2823234 RepID=UPI003929F659
MKADHPKAKRGAPEPRSATEVARRVLREALTDRTMLSAGGLAFFAMFAILPGLAAAGAIYAFFASAEAIDRQIGAFDDVLPEGTAALLSEFLTSVPGGLGLGAGLVVNLLIVFWTVQRSASGIITALNITHDVEEERGRIGREGVALGLAAASLVFLFASLFLLAVLPLLEGGLADAFMWLRWPLLALLFFLYLGFIYRCAPAEPPRRFGWISIGAGVALLLWLAASALFTFYVAGFGGFGTFYGSAAAPMVLMMWLFLTSLVILVGAEINEQLIEAHDGAPKTGLKRKVDEA